MCCHHRGHQTHVIVVCASPILWVCHGGKQAARTVSTVAAARGWAKQARLAQMAKSFAAARQHLEHLVCCNWCSYFWCLCWWRVCMENPAVPLVLHTPVLGQ